MNYEFAFLIIATVLSLLAFDQIAETMKKEENLENPFLTPVSRVATEIESESDEEIVPKPVEPKETPPRYQPVTPKPAIGFPTIRK